MKTGMRFAVAVSALAVVAGCSHPGGPQPAAATPSASQGFGSSPSRRPSPTVMPTREAMKPTRPVTRHTYASPAARTATASAGPAPTSKAPTQAATYYANCAALRKVHPLGVAEGLPGYRAGLDRDQDGWACEP
jgi:hypothetical protein